MEKNLEVCLCISNPGCLPTLCWLTLEEEAVEEQLEMGDMVLMELRSLVRHRAGDRPGSFFRPPIFSSAGGEDTMRSSSCWQVASTTATPHTQTLYTSLPHWPSGKASVWERQPWVWFPPSSWIFLPGGVIPLTSNIGTPVATLPGTWHYRVSVWTGWPRVSILWLGETNYDLQLLSWEESTYSYLSRSIPAIHIWLVCYWNAKQHTNNNPAPFQNSLSKPHEKIIKCEKWLHIISLLMLHFVLFVVGCFFTSIM